MMPFVAVYMQEIVRGHLNSFSTVVSYFTRLSHAEQLQLLDKLTAIVRQS